jgi:hypothetical protein
MLWQNVIIGIVVTVASVYIGVQIWKTLFRKSACCDKGCGSRQQIVSITLGESNQCDIER